MRSAWKRGMLPAAVLLALAAWAFPAYVIVVTFEEPPISSPPPSIGVRYSNKGLLLPKVAQVITLPQQKLTGQANSPTHVLVSRAMSREFDPGPLKINLTYNVEQLSLRTGVPGDTRGRSVRFTLTAFDASGKRIASDTRAATGPTDINLLLLVAAPKGQQIIRKVELEAKQDGVDTFEFADDIDISSESQPPTVVTEPPNVHIYNPTDGSKSTDGKITVAGIITGDGLYLDYAPPEMTVSWPKDPASPLLAQDDYEMAEGTDVKWVYMGGPASGTLGFSVAYQLSYFGQNSVAVAASNAAGKKSDQVSVTYFPAAIESVYNAKPSAFGKFVWGTTIDGCAFAIYDSGAIFSSSAGTYSVFGKVLDKWKSLPASNNFGMLGCATGSEATVAGGVSQDFVHGRIYSGSKGTYYVTQPFLGAIDKLGFVKEFGLPVTDPVNQQKLLRPIRWQKFETTVKSTTFISTMELTDKPSLTLWVATPEIKAAVAAGAQIDSHIPTVWHSFACTNKDQACTNVGKPSSATKKPYADLQTACQNKFYPFGVAQWVPLGGANKIVPYLGTIRESRLTGDDVSWNHACSGYLTDPVDWCTYVLPDPGYEDMLAEDIPASTSGNLIGPFKQDDLEVEYEWCLVGYPYAKDPNDPSKGAEENLKVGNKLFVAGRWISDCGCHPSFPSAPSQYCQLPYQAEIHPPAVMVNMYTGVEYGEPTTVGEILYFDWWYKGESVTLDIYPPPRPEADAILQYSVPLWKSMCTSDQGKCGIKAVAPPAMNHLSVTISGRPDVSFNTNPKEDSGNGQLFHGCAPPLGIQRYVCANEPHDRPILGDFSVGWAKQP